MVFTPMNIFSDLQVDVIVRLVTGSTSASGICRRRSVGRLRHLHKKELVARPSCSQGLLHSAVQQEDHTRKEAVKKLIHQFETHPHREALKADLRQNHAYNPFSEQSKEMIYNMGNMEYFEMCEITSKVQCPHCMTYWAKSIVYCTCGTCLRPSDKTRKLNKDRFDALSIPNYVIKKGPSHGARKHREANSVSRSSPANKARKKGYNSRLDRSLNCPIYRASQIQIGWGEEHCARSDAIAAEDHSYMATAEERKRRENSWVLVLNSSGKNGPMDQREDYAEAIKIKERLYKEYREGNARLHPSEQVRQRASQPFFQSSEGTEGVDPKTGWKWYPSAASSSSSSSWHSCQIILAVPFTWRCTLRRSIECVFRPSG